MDSNPWTYWFDQPAKTYIHHLCVDTRCSLKNLPGAMDGWRERFKELRGINMTWWYIYYNRDEMIIIIRDHHYNDIYHPQTDCFIVSQLFSVARHAGYFNLGVAPSPTPRCRSYWKGSLLVALDYGCQLYWYIIFVCRRLQKDYRRREEKRQRYLLTQSFIS